MRSVPTIQRRPFAIMPIPRLAVLPDFPEEGWPSMDLCADMLLHELTTTSALTAKMSMPVVLPSLGRLPWLGRSSRICTVDRLLNRFHDYPRHLRGLAGNYDLFHLCDHSYAQLVHVLPPGRVGVLCHDLDTFRCLLDPQSEPRSPLFRRMARRVLSGLQKAAIVFYTTDAVRRQLESFRLVDPSCLVQAPLGVSPEFTPDKGPEDDLLSPELRERPYLLHVGSCIPRKRIDVLLDVFAEVRKVAAGLRLIQVGGTWTGEQTQQLNRLGLANAVTQLRGVSRATLAAYYRHARLVLLPSEAEGFGLPVIEALACGAMIVASDIAALREVGGDAVCYCPVADTGRWTETLGRLLSHVDACPPFEARFSTRLTSLLLEVSRRSHCHSVYPPSPP